MGGVRGARGFSLVEVLISLAVMSLTMIGLASMLVQSSRLNKSQQLAADVQANARICLSLIVNKLRSAGWDPRNAGLGVVTLDADPGDGVSQIEVFADLDGDGTTGQLDERVLIRHSGTTVQMRRSTTDPYATMAVNITNDANGDGTVEPMFVPNATPDPTRITVTVTAQSPVRDPVTGAFLRYSVSSDVVLRENL